MKRSSTVSGSPSRQGKRGGEVTVEWEKDERDLGFGSLMTSATTRPRCVGEGWVDFRGFYIPKDRLRLDWWRTDIRRHCYGVPQSALFSMIPFFDEAAGVFKSIGHSPRVLIKNWYRDEQGKARFDRKQYIPIGGPLVQEDVDQRGVDLVVLSENYPFGT